MRRPHVIIYALVAAIVWVALWYLVGSLVWWYFGGK